MFSMLKVSDTTLEFKKVWGLYQKGTRRVSTGGTQKLMERWLDGVNAKRASTVHDSSPSSFPGCSVLKVFRGDCCFSAGSSFYPVCLATTSKLNLTGSTSTTSILANTAENDKEPSKKYRQRPKRVKATSVDLVRMSGRGSCSSNHKH